MLGNELVTGFKTSVADEKSGRRRDEEFRLLLGSSAEIAENLISSDIVVIVSHTAVLSE